MPGYHSDAQKCEARARRRAMSDAEACLWHHLRAHRFRNLHVRRHAPIGPWIVDFLIARHRLVIEVADVAPPDPVRATDIAARGYHILRFWDRDVLRGTAGVLDRIGDEVSARSMLQAEPYRAPPARLPLSRRPSRFPQTQTSA
ncbi:endonuclease domain-containing protein [Pacificoceanicola onchidii]|uniref:endonuclease domain-containing protein n=1 Tax=Pacificoceanicola onchidii TaxID=2562685 RepID=UPI001455F5B1|nr:DUF559 domain-containing protein [Pacificoceanicola onchidii]